jgi:hypothetical protein
MLAEEAGSRGNMLTGGKEQLIWMEKRKYFDYIERTCILRGGYSKHTEQSNDSNSLQSGIQRYRGYWSTKPFIRNMTLFTLTFGHVAINVTTYVYTEDCVSLCLIVCFSYVPISFFCFGNIWYDGKEHY